MKRFLALFLSLSIFLCGCSESSQNSELEIQNEYIDDGKNEDIVEYVETATEDVAIETEKHIEKDINFPKLNDDKLLSYVEDEVYAELVSQLDSEQYFVQNVSAIYLSKEYLETIAYNSKENIFFGYNLSELEAQFQGTKYIFTLGEDGNTVVKAFEDYDDTYEQVLKNVAIGTGVILVCVTVSVVSAGAGAPAVSMVFAASAKTGTAFALSSGVLSGVSAGVVTGIETKDFDQACKAAALSGSEGFKWGAITGAVAGGASEAVALKGATLHGLTMNEAATIQKESGLPLEFIKNMKSMDEYGIYRTAGLEAENMNGTLAFAREIDLKYVDEMGRTNAQRILEGLSPLDENGIAYELHHIGQQADSPLAILTKAEHMQGGNNSILHIIGEDSVVDHGADWQKTVKAFWKAYLKSRGGA